MIFERSCVIFGFFLFACTSQCYGFFFRGPPEVETQINLLDSYIPAAMQVIAHLTETMKYELKPPTVTTTTLPPRPPGPTQGKPTSTHRPGVYAPDKPLGPGNYEDQNSEYQEYAQRIQSGTLETYDDIAPYQSPVNVPKLARVEASLRVQNEELPENLENLIGDLPADLIKLIHSQSPPLTPMDQDEQVQIFSQNYDDSDFRLYLEKNKKAPPTRAYVTLLSLYDLLSKDAKKQGFSNYHGYHQHVLVALSKTSSGTSADQLKFVLEKIIINQDTKQPDIRKKIETLLNDLKMENSYIQKALLYVPPLQFSL